MDVCSHRDHYCKMSPHAAELRKRGVHDDVVAMSEYEMGARFGWQCRFNSLVISLPRNPDMEGTIRLAAPKVPVRTREQAQAGKQEKFTKDALNETSDFWLAASLNTGSGLEEVFWFAWARQTL